MIFGRSPKETSNGTRLAKKLWAVTKEKLLSGNAEDESCTVKVGTYIRKLNWLIGIKYQIYRHIKIYRLAILKTALWRVEIMSQNIVTMLETKLEISKKECAGRYTDIII